MSGHGGDRRSVRALPHEDTQSDDELIVGREDAAGGAGPAAGGALLAALRRLDEALDAEAAFLLDGFNGDLDQITRQKSQCLLDLGRFSRVGDLHALVAGQEGEALKSEILRIKARLAASETMLARYLNAAREVVAIVTDSARVAESDGTYAQAGPFGRYGQ